MGILSWTASQHQSKVRFTLAELCHF